MTSHVRASALLGSTLLSRVPRAISAASVRAEGPTDPKEILQNLQNSFGSFKSEQTKNFDALQKTFAEFKEANDKTFKDKDTVLAETVTKINAAIDEQVGKLKTSNETIEKISKDIDKLNDRMAAAIVNGSGAGGAKSDPRTQNPEYPAYEKAFLNYFRKGEHAVEGGERALRDMEVKAAMSIGSNPDGGYTVVPQMEQAIDATVKEISPMRQLASVVTIGTSEYKKLVNIHGATSGWVGEQTTRPQTQGSQLSELKFPVHEIYAMPGATQSLLDDSFVDITSWLAGEVELEFAQKEAAAFITGDGVNQPAGFINGYTPVANASYAWGKIGFVATGASGAFAGSNPGDCLVDLLHAVKTAYRLNSTFTANRSTLGSIRKLKDGQGNYLLNMVLRPEGFVEEILGRPAVEMPDMPDMGANSYSVAFGDFKRGYLIVDRIGIRVLRDPFTAKPFVLFYTTKRVGGGVQNFEAIKLLKFA